MIITILSYYLAAINRLWSHLFRYYTYFYAFDSHVTQSLDCSCIDSESNRFKTYIVLCCNVTKVYVFSCHTFRSPTNHTTCLGPQHTTGGFPFLSAHFSLQPFHTCFPLFFLWRESRISPIYECTSLRACKGLNRNIWKHLICWQMALLTPCCPWLIETLRKYFLIAWNQFIAKCCEWTCCLMQAERMFCPTYSSISHSNILCLNHNKKMF